MSFFSTSLDFSVYTKYYTLSLEVYESIILFNYLCILSLADKIKWCISFSMKKGSDSKIMISKKSFLSSHSRILFYLFNFSISSNTFLASSLLFLEYTCLLYIIALIDIMWAETGAAKNKNAIANKNLYSNTCR